MSELTKRLRLPYEPELADYLLMMSRLGDAADRIDNLEECLRVLLKALVDSDEEGLIEHAEPIQQARSLLEEK